MRTLVFGAKGQLGRDLVKVFKSAGEVEGHDLPEISIVEPDHVFDVVKQFGPNVIVNAAAYTDVEGAEAHLQETFLANEAGARNVAETAAYHDVPVVYFSTDFVFDGQKTSPYAIDDPISPLSVYGKSKAAGEAATRKANPRHFIIRTAWLYGPGGNNFVEKILRAAATRPVLRVVDDEIGSPTHTLDLAEISFYLARTQAYGVYHAVNRGACSRYEFAREILRLGKKQTEVVPCKAVEFPSKAPRPNYSVLDSARIEEITGHDLRPWQDALKDYMERREDNT